MGEGTSGAPTFCFSFTSDEFEIYHLVDFLGPKGWRFNGQQYPNAIHMAVTRPQTRAGVVEAFAADLADGRRLREGEGRPRARRRSPARSTAACAGGLDQATSRLHRRGDGRHARQAAGPAVRHERPRRPRPGRRPRHRRPQGRLRHHARRGASGGSTRRADARRRRRRADPGRRGVVDGGLRVRTPRRSAAVDASRVVAVSVTGQWASTVPVDEAGRPVGPCVLWSDTRGAPYSRAAVGGPVSGYAPKPLATWLRRSGGIPDTSGADPVGHMLLPAARAARGRWPGPGGCSSRSTT